MSDKKASTPKEIPLHEVVLQLMYEVNKERPAELTVSEVHSRITDPTISETTISEVLRWLVVQKQVECASGKFYSLDRYELIEQRLKEAKQTGKELNLVTEENPLHDVVLNSMYLASQEVPGKFTLDDVYWMISDPKIQKSQVGDVLKWLLNQGRVDYLGGKYSLDQIEFKDQKNAIEKKVSTKKKAPKKPKEKEEVEEIEPKTEKKEKKEKKPKIVIPPSEEELKPTPKKEKLKEEVKEVPVKPAPKKVEHTSKVPVTEVPEKEVAKLEEKPAVGKGRMLALVVLVICVIYSVYLLFALNGSLSANESTDVSGQFQQELVSMKAELADVVENGSLNEQNVAELNEKIRSLEELSHKASDLNTHRSDSSEKSKSLLMRLVMALGIVLALFSWLLVGSLGNQNVKKS